MLLFFLILVSAAAWYRFVQGSGDEISFEERRHRGSRHALANCALPLGLALIWAVTEGMDSFLQLMYVAALATALCDRISTELGILYGRDPRLPLSELAAEPRTPGAVTAEGSLLGVAAVIVFAGLGAILGVCQALTAPAAIAGAAAACWLESVRSEFAGKGDIELDSDWKNFMNTCVGAFLAAFLAIALGGEFYQ